MSNDLEQWQWADEDPIEKLLRNTNRLDAASLPEPPPSEPGEPVAPFDRAACLKEPKRWQAIVDSSPANVSRRNSLEECQWVDEDPFARPALAPHNTNGAHLPAEAQICPDNPEPGAEFAVETVSEACRDKDWRGGPWASLRFRILNKIGEDAIGTLYQAVDARLEKPVAIRILSPAITSDAKFRDRLERDSMAISALRHPNIAELYEWSRQDAIEFAVLEAPKGESMYDYLKRERPNRRNLLLFTAAIASALGAAHRGGFVHGPLNPSAIFITPTNDVKIFDFGFGVLAPPPESEAARMALFGAAAPYVSPEQIQGAAPDIRSDIYSYGTVVYHLTTGRPPFRAGTIGETWKAIFQNEPKPIAQITSRVPRGMDKLVERCMRKNPPAPLSTDLRNRPGSGKN